MNKRRFFTKVIELEALGVAVENSAPALKDMYLVDDDEVKKYLRILSDDTCKHIASLKSVEVVQRWNEAYGEALFGRNDDERFILRAKEHAYQHLALIDRGEISLKKLLDCADPYAQSLAGFVFYFKLQGEGAQEYGKSLLMQAADLGDTDALIWAMFYSTESAEHVLTKLANKSELIANPQALAVWREHFGVKDVEIFSRQIKIGFHS